MESKEWENTRWGKEMNKLQLEGGLEQWEREATEDKGKDAIGIWKKTFKEKKERERSKKTKVQVSVGLPEMVIGRQAKILRIERKKEQNQDDSEIQML